MFLHLQVFTSPSSANRYRREDETCHGEFFPRKLCNPRNPGDKDTQLNKVIETRASAGVVSIHQSRASSKKEVARVDRRVRKKREKGGSNNILFFFLLLASAFQTRGAKFFFFFSFLCTVIFCSESK